MNKSHIKTKYNEPKFSPGQEDELKIEISTDHLSSSVKIDEYNLYLNSEKKNLSDHAKYFLQDCKRKDKPTNLFQHSCYLRINKLNETDIGSYKLELRNNEYNLSEFISFKVYVNKPEINISKPPGCSKFNLTDNLTDDHACAINEELEFECNTTNQNSDHVRITAESCKTLEDCSNDLKNSMNKNKSHPMGNADSSNTTKILENISKIKLNISQPFIISCEAKNDPFGSTNQIFIVIPTDIQGGKIYSIKKDGLEINDENFIETLESDSFQIQIELAKLIFKTPKVNVSKKCKYNQKINEYTGSFSYNISFSNVLAECNNTKIETESHDYKLSKKLNIIVKKNMAPYDYDYPIWLIFLITGLVLSLSAIAILFIIHQRIKNKKFKVYIHLNIFLV